MASIGIGVASWAHGHVNAYCHMIRGFDDAHLVACWDDDVSRGEANGAAFGMGYSPHLEDLLGNPGVQCVIVASETSKHADLAIAALEAGKSVLVQKPLALTLADCDRVASAVARTGQWFSVAYQMRHDVANIRMKQLVEEGAIGRVGIIRRRHCIGVLFSEAFVNGPSRWHVTREHNRGMWMDDASHPCDWLYWMRGKPKSVVAEVDNVLTNVAPDDAGIAVFRYADGGMAEIHNASVTYVGENTTEIYGDKGVIVQNHGDGPSSGVLPPSPVAVKLWQADHADRGWQDLGLPIQNQGERIAGVARPFVDALKAGTPMVPVSEARVSVEMVLAAYESSETGCRVQLTS